MVLHIAHEGVSDFYEHNNIKNRAQKLDALFAVPYVIEQGKIVYGEAPHKDKTYNTVTIVAPVTFTGNGAGDHIPGDYYVAVSINRGVKRHNNIQNAHVVDILIMKKDISDTVFSSLTTEEAQTRYLNPRTILSYVNAGVHIFEDDDTKKACNIKTGYHAGDLGKAEPRSSMSGGRDTSHFGTGTYFVGDKVKIEIGGYKDRPVETVDFGKYNLC